MIDDARFDELLQKQHEWWTRFFDKSSVTLEDKELERHWYTGLYVMACCARNKKFPPGLWGNFSTADGMAWMGDYHLNYNFEAPFYALSSCNHTELMDCYDTPLHDFIPKAKRYARDYLGCRGIYFPVGIGPIGIETDIRPGTKEHSHLFLGQKSNAAYASVIMMMRWYSTYDEDYAREYILPFLKEAATFWEDYLVYRDGKYWSHNDSLNEVEFWAGSDYMPTKEDETNPILTVGLVRMMMKCLVDICTTLGVESDRIPHWQDIAENFGPAKTLTIDDKVVLRGTENEKAFRFLVIQYVYPANAVGPLTSPELLEAARNSIDMLGAWEHDNLFCSFYPAAVRVGVSSDEIIGHMKECIHKHQLPNGMFAFAGGGIENSAAIPMTINEMLLQSYEHVLRFFPNWNPQSPASFRGLRAFGAFVVDGSIRDGVMEAVIRSEKGKTLRVEYPAPGYVLYRGEERIPLTDPITTVETAAGDVFHLIKEN